MFFQIKIQISPWCLVTNESPVNKDKHRFEKNHGRNTTLNNGDNSCSIVSHKRHKYDKLLSISKYHTTDETANQQTCIVVHDYTKQD